MNKKILTSSIILFNILVSVPVQAITINDCTNKIYTEVYDTLTPFEKYKTDGFDVNIVNNKLNNLLKQNTSVSEDTLGYINVNTKTIYVSNDKKDSEQTSRILLHENFHAIDYGNIKSTSQVIYPNGKIEYFDSSHWDFGYYSNTKEFIDIFNKEKNSDIKLYSNEKYFCFDSSEYFAECGAIYHINGDKLKRLAPKTYEYLDKIIKQEIK